MALTPADLYFSEHVWFVIFAFHLQTIGILFMVIAFLFCIGVVIGGKKWWNNIANIYYQVNPIDDPPELPLLNGPEDRSYEVAQRFISIQQRLIPFGLDLREMNLDERGAWEMTLSNGISIRIGRRNISEKFDFFIDVVANFILSQDTAISFIDMRYDNGFSVSHKK